MSWDKYNRKRRVVSFSFEAKKSLYRDWLTQSHTLTPPQAGRLKTALGIPAERRDREWHQAWYSIMLEQTYMYNTKQELIHPNIVWSLDQDRRCRNEPWDY